MPGGGHWRRESAASTQNHRWLSCAGSRSRRGGCVPRWHVTNGILKELPRQSSALRPPCGRSELLAWSAVLRGRENRPLLADFPLASVRTTCLRVAGRSLPCACLAFAAACTGPRVAV